MSIWGARGLKPVATPFSRSETNESEVAPRLQLPNVTIEPYDTIRNACLNPLLNLVDPPKPGEEKSSFATIENVHDVHPLLVAQRGCVNIVRMNCAESLIRIAPVGRENFNDRTWPENRTTWKYIENDCLDTPCGLDEAIQLLYRALPARNSNRWEHRDSGSHTRQYPPELRKDEC
jgi:hypothetical protein